MAQRREDDGWAQGEVPEWAEVALSVYELTGTSGINYLTSSAGLGGAYHVGVEVYGLEWSFGGRDFGSGLDVVYIGQSSLGYFHSRLPLGRTRKSPQQVLDILDEYRRTWHGDTYHLLARNCGTFSVEFTKRLGFNNQPEWINSLAATGAGLTGALATELPRPRKEEDLDAFDDDEVEEMAEDGDKIAMLELVWRQAVELTLDHVEKAKHNAKSEDFDVEFRWLVSRDDATRRSIALAIMRDDFLADAIGGATAAALNLQATARDGQDEPTCAVTITKLQTLSGLRVKAKCRVKGGENIKLLKRRLATTDHETFATKFKNSMKTAHSWSKDQKALMDSIVLDTSPGQPALSHRVLTCSRAKKGGTASQRGGEIFFPQKALKAPESSHRTLEKLQQLRQRVLEQSTTHRTLKAMQNSSLCDPAPPWWATSPATTYGGYNGYGRR